MAAGAFFTNDGAWSVGPPAGGAGNGTVTFTTCLAYARTSRLRVWHHYVDGRLSAIDLCVEAPGWAAPPPPFAASPRLDAADIAGDWTAANLRVVVVADRRGGRSVAARGWGGGTGERSIGLGWSAAPGVRVVLIRTMGGDGRLLKAAARVERQARRA
ncbi:hypothetical protein I4F81_008294 [Pyropia yezoensis]|uniref:Uncharacterized protein n=1 Tax=Pyropia yezoensis TaxID=2788 RepID=A0ACC3C639_PYRYE|nr:hypothetical protein I4F81_008294 [Neopyropia yezoensis]